MRFLIISFMILFMIGIVVAECTDTDTGKNKYEQGTVTDQKAGYTDSCEEEDIREYFCSTEAIAEYTLLQCVNGCENGQCILAKEIPVQTAPENNATSNHNLYLYGFVILIIIGIYLYLFKIRKKKRY